MASRPKSIAIDIQSQLPAGDQFELLIVLIHQAHELTHVGHFLGIATSAEKAA